MAIRLPLKTVLSSDNSTEVGAASVNGGIALPFTLPQDTDNIVVKFQSSMVGTGISATFQTTDDGGTTWMDVARTSIVSNAIHNTSRQTAEWLSIPVIGFGNGGIRASTVAVGSVIVAGNSAGGIGATSASTLAQDSYSGLPILSQQARMFIIINGDITSAASNVLITEVKVNNQDATA